MKKNTIQSLVAFIDGENVTNIQEIRGELVAELQKNEVKVNAKRELYDAAHDAVMRAITFAPHTIQEIMATTELPEGFTRAKLQYALREVWADEIIKGISGKVHTYQKK